VRQQFEALRDGDRFFYGIDPELARIGKEFGITYRHTLAELISLNSGARVPADVFEVAPSTTDERPTNRAITLPVQEVSHLRSMRDDEALS
jgi:hypothetical protein